MAAFLNPEAPLIPPPEGVQSNFDNPPNGNQTINGVVASGLALTIVTLALYTYGKTKNKLHLDDCEPHYPFYVYSRINTDSLCGDFALIAVVCFIVTRQCAQVLLIKIC